MQLIFYFLSCSFFFTFCQYLSTILCEIENWFVSLWQQWLSNSCEQANFFIGHYDRAMLLEPGVQGKDSNCFLLGKNKAEKGQWPFEGTVFLSSPILAEYKSLSKGTTLNVAKSVSATPLTYKEPFPSYSATTSKHFPKVSLGVSCTSRRFHRMVVSVLCRYSLAAIHVGHCWL